jgi:hypothetical protein
LIDRHSEREREREKERKKERKRKKEMERDRKRCQRRDGRETGASPDMPVTGFSFEVRLPPSMNSNITQISFFAATK